MSVMTQWLRYNSSIKDLMLPKGLQMKVTTDFFTASGVFNSLPDTLQSLHRKLFFKLNFYLFPSAPRLSIKPLVDFLSSIKHLLAVSALTLMEVLLFYYSPLLKLTKNRYCVSQWLENIGWTTTESIYIQVYK